MGSFTLGHPPPNPGFGRMMVFIDGENLVFRFQDMLDGRVPRENVSHIQDAVAWEAQVVTPMMHNIIRATYYTYVVGDDQKLDEVAGDIKRLSFTTHPSSQLPHCLTPCVYKKKKGEKGKGVDIKMTVDILTHVHHNNVDTVYLVSGDGDFLPIVKEVIHSGKNVFLAALSSGLNKKLLNYVDHFTDLDPMFFE